MVELDDVVCLRSGPILKYISIHFPKAGGSSLLEQLKGQLGPDLLLDYDHDPVASNRVQAAEHLPVQASVVHGHFHASRYDAIANAVRFTFLRDPVENLISIYFFWRQLHRQGHPWHDRFLDEKPSIERFATYRPLQRLGSETYFGGYDMKRLDFIGFHETRDRDLPRLGDILGLRLNSDQHSNKTPESEERSTLLADRRRMGVVRSLLVDDIRFYERHRSVA
jgi:hypothetical protein